MRSFGLFPAVFKRQWMSGELKLVNRWWGCCFDKLNLNVMYFYHLNLMATSLYFKPVNTLRVSHAYYNFQFCVTALSVVLLTWINMATAQFLSFPLYPPSLTLSSLYRWPGWKLKWSSRPDDVLHEHAIFPHSLLNEWDGYVVNRVRASVKRKQTALMPNVAKSRPFSCLRL